MTIYRLVKEAHAEDAFRGSRGRGRWHRRFVPMVYAADQPATTLLETLAHAGRTELLEAPYMLFAVTLEGEHLLRLPTSVLPADWQAWPWPASTQEIGSYWFESKASPVLEVPSAVVPYHRNYLINPQHPVFSEFRMEEPESFPIDPRLAGVESTSSS